MGTQSCSSRTMFYTRSSRRISLIFCLALLFGSSLTAQTAHSPLRGYGTKWDSAKYLVANTAAGVSYLDENEKGVIYVLNLARMDPQQFAMTVLRKMDHYGGLPTDSMNVYFRSLLQLMDTLRPLPLLYPDSGLFVTADCHAVSSGRVGYAGHVRQDDRCTMIFDAECCSYGFNDPISIIAQLLIDNNVPSLGHRVICLSSCSQAIGVAIRTHTVFGYTGVLDFKYASIPLLLGQCPSFPGH
jgi:hypothetical protein